MKPSDVALYALLGLLAVSVLADIALAIIHIESNLGTVISGLIGLLSVLIGALWAGKRLNDKGGG